MYLFFCQVTQWLELTHFKCREIGCLSLNPDPYIYYAMPLSIEISSQELCACISKLKMMHI